MVYSIHGGGITFHHTQFAIIYDRQNEDQE